MPETRLHGGGTAPEDKHYQDEEWAQMGLWPEESPHVSDLYYAASDIEHLRPTKRILSTCTDNRPRDRLRAHGPRSLETEELLSLLLGTANYPSQHLALDPVQSIIQAIGANGYDILRHLRHTTMEELQTLPGIGPARAAAIIAAIELGKRALIEIPPERTCIDDPAVAAELFSHDLMWEQQERFALLMLNIRNHFIGKRVVSIGTQTETLANPREIFGEALRCRAVRIIVAHNHPSGSVEPSPEDIALTRQLIEGGKLLDLPVLDHLILGDGKFRSLRQTTSLWQECS
jgi:DNA repair protein RadC